VSLFEGAFVVHDDMVMVHLPGRFWRILWRNLPISARDIHCKQVPKFYSVWYTDNKSFGLFFAWPVDEISFI
jgi:hypothetical protein